MIPINPEELFEWNPNYTFSIENNVLICDNWYKNPEDILYVMSHMPVSRGKWAENSRNWIDYYDCRPSIRINFPKKCFEPIEEIVRLLREHFVDAVYDMSTDIYEFNAYRNIKKDIPNTLQHYPHQDHDYFNCIVYLDRVCSGGTALYNMKPIPLREEHNLLYDVSGIEKFVIPARFNRLVIFDGNIMHGGYIEDHNAYIDNWRIDHTMTLTPQLPCNEE